MEFYRGVVRSYDGTNHRADVLLVGSMSRALLKTPVAQQIGPELMVEGAACGVAFFAEVGTGLVVCTFDGAPEGWVTSELIKDGEVAPADLAFSPATPAYSHDSTSVDQTVTTTPTTYQSLSQTVTVPAGKTYNVLVMANVEFECTSYSNWNIDVMAIFKGSNQYGQPQGRRHNAVNERGSCSVVAADQIFATTTYSAKVYKAVDRNAEVAHRGNLAVLYWEATA
jgi:hypothetical protein